ncbi:TetR family transcriptional regulator [Galbitalea sp. SE-J8]|uniref:TetR/AcrR family transcriptional regulator n=1 Tax=Galbitalea sp. SE-J8 TaxID=3054952 RepID=UPI00259CCB4D|nr:TetR family transcriptional regulator [Galbitalea sp. SE-J8]MDM4763666.1 TetR family transcriptional regulator [Galbitalea sp. SE-J8]
MTPSERADAARNRRSVLDAAQALFTERGLETTVRDIAAAAGVGAGTVGRHFATKEALYTAVFEDRVDALLDEAEALIESGDPNGFETLFGLIVQAGQANRGLSQALANDGFDLSAATSGDRDVMARLDVLLQRARAARLVRADVVIADVKRMVTLCAGAADAAASARLQQIVLAGLVPA